MLDTTQALAAISRNPPRLAAALRRALVVGAGGALGAAVLEQVLATRRFERVGALVEAPMQPAVHGFVAVRANDAAAFGADTALVVFDRQRNANGREAAFVRPAPEGLLALAQRLFSIGTRRVIVAVPHTPSLLPMALQQGGMDEAAVAALGFEQLVFMRMAQDVRETAVLDAPQRLARWMLSQLRWMIPQREQPVRAETVARLAAALAVQLPDVPHATRVVPAALLWQAAQARDAAAVVADWLLPKAAS
jgi:hypothetical protein